MPPGAPGESIAAATRRPPRRAAPRKPGGVGVLTLSLAAFFAVLAILAWRMSLGDDPALGQGTGTAFGPGSGSQPDRLPRPRRSARLGVTGPLPPSTTNALPVPPPSAPPGPVVVPVPVPAPTAVPPPPPAPPPAAVPQLPPPAPPVTSSSVSALAEVPDPGRGSGRSQLRGDGHEPIRLIVGAPIRAGLPDAERAVASAAEWAPGLRPGAVEIPPPKAASAASTHDPRPPGGGLTAPGPPRRGRSRTPPSAQRWPGRSEPCSARSSAPATGAHGSAIAAACWPLRWPRAERNSPPVLIRLGAGLESRSTRRDRSSRRPPRHLDRQRWASARGWLRICSPGGCGATAGYLIDCGGDIRVGGPHALLDPYTVMVAHPLGRPTSQGPDRLGRRRDLRPRFADLARPRRRPRPPPDRSGDQAGRPWSRGDLGDGARPDRDRGRAPRQGCGARRRGRGGSRALRATAGCWSPTMRPSRLSASSTRGVRDSAPAAAGDRPDRARGRQRRPATASEAAPVR